MLVRETIYYLMSDKQLSKRINRLEAKIKNETDPKERIKHLGDVADLVKTTLRKNRRNEKFLREFRITMQDLRNKSEEQKRD